MSYDYIVLNENTIYSIKLQVIRNINNIVPSEQKCNKYINELIEAYSMYPYANSNNVYRVIDNVKLTKELNELKTYNNIVINKVFDYLFSSEFKNPSEALFAYALDTKLVEEKILRLSFIPFIWRVLFDLIFNKSDIQAPIYEQLEEFIRYTNRYRIQNNKNIFIVIEGIDGIGKDTILNGILLDNRLKRKYHLVSAPGGLEKTKKLRDVILHENINSTTEALLFVADRSELDKEISKLLDETNIISNRYIYSNIYQTLKHNKDNNILSILDLEKSLVTNYPDLVISLYNSDLNVIEDRINNIESPDNIEQEIKNNVDTMREINKYYSELDKHVSNFEKVITYDVKDKSKDNIIKEIVDIIESYVAK